MSRFHLFIVASVAMACATPSQTSSSVTQQGRPAPAPAPSQTTSRTSGSATQGAAPRDTTPPEAGRRTPSIASVTRTSRKYDGLFTIYQDTLTGSTQLAIKEDQIGREFIYFPHVMDAPASIAFRGAFGNSQPFTVRRVFNKLQFVVENANFYFDPRNPLSRAADANTSTAVVASSEIVARDSGVVLVKADGLFLTEAFFPVKPFGNTLARPGTTLALGTLSRDKTRYLAIRSYPENADVMVEYVFENPLPTIDPRVRGTPALGGREVVDARNVSIRVQHSFIAMPKEAFAPRLDDPRVGYFTQEQNDMTTTRAANYRDMINRWKLVKKEPGAALSEPVEPIVWWIENTTPVEMRPTITAAVLAWNSAFEAAGFRNAMVVRQQPDDATWDAGDIRYNVLRWTSSPSPQFGGYGPSFANPRTGQLIGADIMLEYVFVTNRLRQERLFETAALGLESLESQAMMRDPRRCDAALHLHMNTLFGLHVLRAEGAAEMDIKRYLDESLFYLVIHEVGHTLGLNHNMKSSQMLTPDQLTDRALGERMGIAGSIMDYPLPNIAAPGQKQGVYFPAKPGPYDVWAIQFGYSEALPDAAAERRRLDALLARSNEPGLAFGNDADDMRTPGSGIDPRVQINDMSSDVIGYSVGRFRRANDLLQKLRARYSTNGENYHELRSAYLIATGQNAQSAAAVSRYVGGVYVDRAVEGQRGATTPFRPVPRSEQKRAMAALRTYLFAPDAFDAPEELLNHLQMQRRGFDFFGTTEDPKLHDRALAVHRQTLDHLLHPVMLTRLTDASLYGNDYSAAEMLTDLTAAIFDADAAGTVNGYRRNLQLEFVERLSAIMRKEAPGYDASARSAAYTNLRSVDRMLAAKSAGNDATRAHTQHLRFVIARALETNR